MMREDKAARFAEVSAVRRRHRLWVDAGRPGTLASGPLLDRITLLEYAVRSFAQWHAAHEAGARKLTSAPEVASWALGHRPNPAALKIAEQVFERSYADGLTLQPDSARLDVEALLLEMHFRGEDEVAQRRRRREECATRPHQAVVERFGLDVPPPRLLVVPGGTDDEQAGMHGEGTFP